jgi:hypothetical protein
VTIDALISEVLNQVRNNFYADRPAREFLRDERAIMRAIARYGAECERRGWNFQVEFMWRELTALLRSMREKAADIKYLPVYLEGAVDRHIRLRAEELSAAAKLPKNIAMRTLKDVAVVQTIEATPVETLALLYKDLRKRQKSKQRRTVAAPKQGSLL